MKVSAINHRNDSYFFCLREDLVRITGHTTSALLLDYFVYWYDLRLASLKQTRKWNDVSEFHGERRSQYEGLLQWHTLDEIKDQLFGMFSPNTIRKYIKELVNLGFISIHKNPNPRFKFDSTQFFAVYPERINKAIDESDTKTIEKPEDVELINPDADLDDRKSDLDSRNANLCSENADLLNIKRYNTNTLPNTLEKDNQLVSNAESVEQEKTIGQTNQLDPSFEKSPHRKELLNWSHINGVLKPLYEKYKLSHWEDVYRRPTSRLNAIQNIYQACNCDLKELAECFKNALEKISKTESLGKCTFGYLFKMDRSQNIMAGDICLRLAEENRVDNDKPKVDNHKPLSNQSFRYEVDENWVDPKAPAIDTRTGADLLRELEEELGVSASKTYGSSTPYGDVELLDQKQEVTTW